MFKQFIITITICLPLVSVAQGKSPKPADDNTSISLYKKMFANALALEDNATALQACHLIVAQQGSNSPYKDSLAMLYYSLGSYKQTLLLTLGLLQQQPNNTTLLGITADSYNKLGAVKEAITHQEKLYQLQPNAVNGFGLLEMQMSLQRNAEGLATATAVLNNKIDSNLVYNYKDTTGKQQQTPLKAAIYNYMATAYYKQGNKAKAKDMLNAALQVDDKFLIAKLNKEAIKE